MATATHYLMLERISFKLQTVSAEQTPEDLEMMEIEVEDADEVSFQCITAQHNPDYVGGGTGEMFFPMENGVYDSSGGPWRSG